MIEKLVKENEVLRKLIEVENLIEYSKPKEEVRKKFIEYSIAYHKRGEYKKNTIIDDINHKRLFSKFIHYIRQQ